MRNTATLLALRAGAVLFVTATGTAAQTAGALPRPVPVHGIVDGYTLVRTARQYLGVRYVLGGTTPRAFDCSGFVGYVFKQHGIAVPRTAHEQSALGRRPDEGDLQPGTFCSSTAARARSTSRSTSGTIASSTPRARPGA